MTLTIVLAQDQPTAIARCRNLGIAPHGRDTVLVGAPHGLFGLRFEEGARVLVCPTFDRHRYRRQIEATLRVSARMAGLEWDDLCEPIATQSKARLIEDGDGA